MTAYQRIADSLRQRLLAGRWPPGQQLPTERELCQQFTTSQITVRRALQILESEHLVERRQGAGTFAASTTMRKIPILNADYFGSVSRHSPRLKRRLHDWRWDTIDAQLADVFHACVGDSVLRAMRIDLLLDRPVALDEVAIPGRYAERLDRDDFKQLDFIERWQRVQKIHLERCVQSIEAVKAGASIGRLLNVRAGEPLLKESDLMYVLGQPAGLFVTYYRHDSFRFEVTFDLEGQSARGAKHG